MYQPLFYISLATEVLDFGVLAKRKKLAEIRNKSYTHYYGKLSITIGNDINKFAKSPQPPFIKGGRGGIS